MASVWAGLVSVGFAVCALVNFRAFVTEKQPATLLDALNVGVLVVIVAFWLWVLAAVTS